ncbi:MAG: hypothetical protein KF845_11340 [Cyclobacteriaceae bacterium]|nr:hypothetical protein [Cyclobacteriaceae bacterium]
MKTSRTLPVFLALFLITSSCGLFDDLQEISFDGEIPVNFFVNETADNPDGKAYSAEQLLDIKDDPDIAEYASKIKDVKVNSVTYYVYDLAGSGVIFSGGSIVSLSNNKTVATLTNLPLVESANGNFSIDNTGLNELSTRLKNNKSETIRLQGNLSKTPVSFYVECRFHVTITADALK